MVCPTLVPASTTSTVTGTQSNIFESRWLKDISSSKNMDVSLSVLLFIKVVDTSEDKVVG